MTYFLTAGRLGWRTWQPDDLALAVGLWADPDVTRHIRSGPPATEADAAARLEAEMACQDAHGIQYWPIFLLADGSHVGCCGLRPYQDGILELGVHLRPAFWGQGLAVEAARAVVAHAFGALGARSLFAGHNPANTASQGLLRKLGFRHTHDEFYAPTGLMHPSYQLEAPRVST